MPEEFSRTTARKKVILPSGDEIYVPVITKISFIDPYKQYQEYQYQIDNTAEVERTVHIDRVSPVDVDEDGGAIDDPPEADTSQELFVERIDTWNVVDPFDQHQESRMTLDNITGNDHLPPHFSTHTRTHIYRYHQDPQNPDDDGVWIDSELLDQFAIIDPFEQYQERQFTLSNPTNQEFRDGDLTGQASEDDPEITIEEGEGIEDNPVRLDPFQNIVNFNSTPPEFYMRFDLAADLAAVTHVEGQSPSDTGTIIIHFPDTPPPPNPIVDPTLAISDSRTIGWTVAMQSFGIRRPPDGPVITGPGPIVTLSQATQSFDDWQYFYRSPGGIQFVNLWGPPAGAIPGGGVVTGSPLLDAQGHPIQDVIDTLQAHYINQLCPVDGPHSYSRASNPHLPPPDHSDPATWINYQTGTFSGNFVTVTEQTVMVSAAPFEFDGKMYQAKGLYPITSSVAFDQVFIYCVRFLG